MLKIKELYKAYSLPGGAGFLPVLSGIDLEVQTGKMIAIMGPSGCGKSTLLNLMGGLDRPDRGQIILDGVDLATLNEKELARIRNRSIGFVFQQHHLLPQCTVLENVLMPVLANGKHRAQKEDYDQAWQLLERVGMKDHASHLPGELSGGQCQRVAFVRALINSPALLLADEPTGALDEQNARALMDVLVEINRQRSTALVVVTHSGELAGRMDEVYSLHNGRLSRRDATA